VHRRTARVRVARFARAVSGQDTTTGKLEVSLCCLSVSWFMLSMLWLMGTRQPSQGKGHRRGGSSGQRPRSPYRLQPLHVEVKVIIDPLDRKLESQVAAWCPRRRAGARMGDEGCRCGEEGKEEGGR